MEYTACAITGHRLTRFNMQTVNYARRKKLPITLIHPDSAVVSYENQD